MTKSKWEAIAVWVASLLQWASMSFLKFETSMKVYGHVGVGVGTVLGCFLEELGALVPLDSVLSELAHEFGDKKCIQRALIDSFHVLALALIVDVEADDKPVVLDIEVEAVLDAHFHLHRNHLGLSFHRFIGK